MKSLKPKFFIPPPNPGLGDRVKYCGWDRGVGVLNIFISLRVTYIQALVLLHSLESSENLLCYVMLLSRGWWVTILRKVGDHPGDGG